MVLRHLLYAKRLKTTFCWGKQNFLGFKGLEKIGMVKMADGQGEI